MDQIQPEHDWKSDLGEPVYVEASIIAELQGIAEGIHVCGRSEGT